MCGFLSIQAFIYCSGKKKYLTWIVQTESVSEWRRVVFQRQQFVHISVHIPVQVAMFDFSLMCYHKMEETLKKKKRIVAF